MSIRVPACGRAPASVAGALGAAVLLPACSLWAQVRPFTFLQSGYTAELYAAASIPSNVIFAGAGFAPGGDLWIKTCATTAIPLRFDASRTVTVNATSVHPRVTGIAGTVPFSCGMTSHPDGRLYLNTVAGVQGLDASTGAVLALIGPPGNNYGITVDPQTNRLVYPAAACVGRTTCQLITVDPASGNSQTFATISAPANFADVDGITFDPSGNYLVAAGRTGSAPNDAPFLTVYGRNGGVVRQLPAEHYPDGGVFHTDPFYLAVNNNDGTITRYDFPNDDLRQAPSQSLIASGGFRGDLAEAGPDGCLYATQGGARYANGASTSENSVVRLCSPAGQFVSMAVARSGAPRIRDNDPVLPSFQGKSGFGSNMYVEIYGTNLAPATRLWSGADFKGPAAPTSLDGVSVTVNGKPAFIYYISPQQININTPDDTATGAVNIQVKTPQGPSNIVSAVRTRLSPALQSSAQFAAGGKQYVVAQTPDFLSFIGPPGLVPGANFTAARPGDTVSMYALGCGATNPATQAGVAASQNSPIAARFEMRIGGVAASVPFAGMVGGSIGLYQINAVIPNIAAGDQPVELIVDGVPNAQNLVITIGEPFP